MSRELLSTNRPSGLRVAGFFFLAFGATAAGIGATREWAAVGFPADQLGVADVSVRGTDVWEGKVVLLAAAVALVALVAMRISRSTATRVGLGWLLVAVGVVCVVLPLLAAVRAEDRFGGANGVDRMAEVLAAELELPEDVVREQLAEQFDRALRVVIGPGLWLTVLGGALVIVGGVLGLRWAHGSNVPAAPDPTALDPEAAA
jgi:Tryptophan-associated transmembrane protein (Trp_oprn_chp)